MQVKSGLAMVAAVLLSACGVTSPGDGPVSAALPDIPARVLGANTAPERMFRDVVTQMEPVVERECRQRSPQLNCDFLILVDDRPNQSPNAFQTLDENDRPILGFTLSLIRDVANEDEMAFVFGHEAAHHIAGHIGRQQQNSTLGAVVFGTLAARSGASAEALRSAQELGAAVGARSYSKNFELEADALGTVLTQRAGYDALRGAAYFTRIPDPGDRFLGTHPPNAARMDTVRRTVADL